MGTEAAAFVSKLAQQIDEIKFERKKFDLRVEELLRSVGRCPKCNHVPRQYDGRGGMVISVCDYFYEVLSASGLQHSGWQDHSFKGVQLSMQRCPGEEHGH